MIDIKNSSTDYLQRTTGTFNNISMLFAGKFYFRFSINVSKYKHQIEKCFFEREILVCNLDMNLN